MSLQDFSIVSAVVNMFTMLGNVYWSFKLSGIRSTNELTSYWKAECEKKDNQIKDKDEVIKHMIDKKNQLKYQYQQLLALNKEIEGKLTTYEKFHQH